MGNLARAHDLIDAVSRTGANAIKFQTYKPETMTLDLPHFRVSEDHELWGRKKLYDLYKEAQMPWDWHPELFEHARKVGLIPFSTPFDLTAVDFLEDLNCPIYKVASLESGDLGLIERIGQTGKPCILSTGATEFEEIVDAVTCYLKTGNTELTLLVCTSSYPAIALDANINRMKTLKEYFGLKVGISDHTLGIGVSLAAIALGANVVEKHFTLDRSEGGLDSQFSLVENEFRYLVNEGKNAFQSLGESKWQVIPSEKESRLLRRSLYVVKDVEAGQEVSLENVKPIRPGQGAKPKEMKNFIGKRFSKFVKAGTPMSSQLLE